MGIYLTMDGTRSQMGSAQLEQMAQVATGIAQAHQSLGEAEMAKEWQGKPDLERQEAEARKKQEDEAREQDSRLGDG